MSRAEFAGKRLAVIGLGVSGVAMCEAAAAIGAVPVGFDEIPSDVPRVREAVDRLQALGIEAVTGWHGELEPGFDWILVSPGLPPGHPVIEAWKGKVMGEVEFAFRIAEAPILAVTGTNGKSTTTVMLYKILKHQGAILCGNIAGSGYPEHVLSTAALKTPSDGVLVAEVSSAQLETVISFRPKVACITNITEDHQDRYGSMEKYRAAKMNLFKNMAAGDTIVWNGDDGTVALTGNETAEVLTVLPKRGEGRYCRRSGATIWFGDREFQVADLPFLGEMNVANAMVAWTMACAYTVGARPGMVEGLLSFQPLEHRMEPLGVRDGVQVVNNSMCTNPMAVINSCESLSSKLHILMGGNTKNGDYSPLREYLQQGDQKVYLYGSDAKHLNGLLGGGYPEYPDLESAFTAAVAAAQAGEVVMLAPGCASSGPYKNFKERGAAFKKIAKEWLNT